MFSGAVYQGNGDGARFDFFSRVRRQPFRLVSHACPPAAIPSAHLFVRLAPTSPPPTPARLDDTYPPTHPLQAALEFLLRTGRQPDILHCHDWSSADVAKTYWNEYHHYGLWKPKVVSSVQLRLAGGRVGGRCGIW